MPAHPPSAISILMVDDHPIFRAGLRMMIEGEAELKIVGEAGNGAEALAVARREQPDVILLDLSLGGAISLDLIPDLLAASPKSRVLVLTGMREAELYQQAGKLGARGVVLKELAFDSLIKAVKAVHGGEPWVCLTFQEDGGLPASPAKEPLSGTLEDKSLASLTKRERQIIALICQGLKNQQAADHLSISEGTVRNHLTIIFEKLQLSGRFELIVFAHRHGLHKGL